MYSGIDRQAEWILTRALDEAAAATPDRIWVLSTEGGQLTFGEAAEQTRRSAGFFARLGVRSGDRIAVMMPGGIDFIRVWLGLSRLGAVPVFINCELRGAFLKHQVVQSAVETAVVHSDVLPSLGKLDDRCCAGSSLPEAAPRACRPGSSRSTSTAGGSPRRTAARGRAPSTLPASCSRPERAVQPRV
jgi:crotonobetaine/carnitine-CoA ligase